MTLVVHSLYDGISHHAIDAMERNGCCFVHDDQVRNRDDQPTDDDPLAFPRVKGFLIGIEREADIAAYFLDPRYAGCECVDDCNWLRVCTSCHDESFPLRESLRDSGVSPVGSWFDRWTDLAGGSAFHSSANHRVPA